VKVRMRARGFMVKVWNGQGKSAPKPKPKPEQIVPRL
jgi:hypothetical protein